MSVRVLIADDHEVVRRGLRLFLGLDPEIEVVAEASDGAQACAMSAQLRPDVVLMDLIMPVMDGVTAIGVIRRDLPGTEVIALTAVLEDDLVGEAIEAGAIGCLLKDTGALDLRQTIKAVAAGKLALSPQAAARLMRGLKPLDKRVDLSEQERQVLSLVARGCSNREIGQALQVSDPTVNGRITGILGKFEVSSRTQAVLHALRLGLITLGPG